MQKFVVFTGYVLSEEVPVLMNGAIAFTFPSLYEGFGLPVVEAMACGTPVITSFNTSLKEVASDACVLVDPSDVNEIADGMEKVFINKELRKILSEKGMLKSKEYTWKHSADCLKGIYREI